MTLRIGSLFSGYGGLDGAVERFFDADVAWHVEYDDGVCPQQAYAALVDLWATEAVA